MSEPTPDAAAASNVRPLPSLTSRSAAFIGSFSLLGRLLERGSAFALIVLLASVYGSSSSADLYFVASIVPLMIGTLVGESIAAGTVPLLVRRREERDLAGTVGAGLWLTLGLAIALTGLYLAITIPLVELVFGRGLDRLGPWLAFAPIAILLSVAGYLGGVLLRLERYVWPPFRLAAASLAGLALALAVITVTRDVTWVAAAVAAGHAFAVVLLVLEVSHVMGARWLGPPSRAHVRDVLHVRSRVGASVASALLGGQVLVLLERALAATLGIGAVATLSYARGVAFTPNVLGHSIAAGLYPGMVRAHEASREAAVRERFSRGLRLTLFVAVPTAVFFLAFGSNVIGFLLQRGAFGAEATETAGTLLAAFALALAANMVMIFASRVFQSVDYFRATVVAQALVVAVYLLVALPMREVLDLTGLALAFGVAEAAGAVAAVTIATRRLDIGRGELVRSVLVPGLARGAVVALVLVVYRLALALVEIPVDLLGLAYVGGTLLLFALATTLMIATSPWPESRRFRAAARAFAHPE
jgi:putative peptidoglycan lipid II flippase